MLKLSFAGEKEKKEKKKENLCQLRSSKRMESCVLYIYIFIYLFLERKKTSSQLPSHPSVMLV
jgi:hypothetical protein